MKLQKPSNVDSISCGSFEGCKELTEMMHPATHQRRRGERIRGTEGDANAWIEWDCAWVLWCGRQCAVMSLDAESSPASAASGKYFARMYTQCKGWMQSELRFGGSAMFQQQCKVSTAVWSGSECGIRHHSRQIIHQWIIPAKHFSGDFNSSSLSYDLLFD